MNKFAAMAFALFVLGTCVAPREAQQRAQIGEALARCLRYAGDVHRERMACKERSIAECLELGLEQSCGCDAAWARR